MQLTRRALLLVALLAASVQIAALDRAALLREALDLYKQAVEKDHIRGAVLYVAGPQVLKALAFPIGFLVLMIPLPGIVCNSIAFPLQLLAAKVSSAVLEIVGVPVFREGNVMHLAAASLDPPPSPAAHGIRFERRIFAPNAVPVFARSL